MGNPWDSSKRFLETNRTHVTLNHHSSQYFHQNFTKPIEHRQVRHKLTLNPQLPEGSSFIF
uniref:Uncharacterized protein n=1 Tax=Rhizophora mucronata TaxID=61149 RepID=A0A2P2NHY7_RHIMU